MLVALLSDTHLGYRFGTRLNASGYNLREADVEAALHAVIDGVIAAKPRLVLWGGDVFDMVQPPPRAVATFIREVRRSQAALPDTTWIINRGNHETSRYERTGSVLAMLSLIFPDLHIVDDQPYTLDEHGVERQPERIFVDDVAVLVIPWCRTDADFKRAVSEARPVEGYFNILLLHAGLADIPAFQYLVPGSQTLTPGEIPSGFDLVASGHFHGFRVFEEHNVVFIGNTEHLSSTEAGDDKGWLTYDTVTRRLEFHRIPTRPYLSLDDIDGSAFDGATLLATLRDIRESLGGWSDKMLKLRIYGLRPDVMAALDPVELGNLRAEPVHFDLRLESSDLLRETAPIEEDAPAIRDLDVEWRAFAAAALAERDASLRTRILELGERFLRAEKAAD